MNEMRKSISGWGKYPVADCQIRVPQRRSAVASMLDAAGTLGRGLGRSYGDTALNQQGVVLDCTSLDQYIAFDEANALLTCEAGVSLEQILEDFGPRGFLPKITPGTKFVTVGGCIANDVHGKAHHVDGCFANSVRSMRLLLASGEVKELSREKNTELFWATCGGVGLTGIILDATIELRPVETTYFRQNAIPVRDLDHLLEQLAEQDALVPYSVAWVDSLATGKRLGRGVLTTGDHATLSDLPKRLRKNPLRTTPPSPVVLPFDMPSGALNSLTVRALNAVLEQVQAHGAEIAHYEKFYYPLDFVGEWNRGYGSAGFTQYQFVVPFDDGPRVLRTILERIAKSGQAPFLNVLKRLGAANDSHLSFPFAGYTFAIDFPVRSGLRELLADLDRLVLDAGGRLYLGKDAFVSAQTFAQMYPRLDEWKAIKAKVDPDNVFTSDLGRRVGLIPT